MTTNLNNFKKMYEYQKKVNKKMVYACLNSLTKTELIEFLLKKKIIQQDWIKDGNKYRLKE